jgi:hypothetical protein
MSMTLSGDGAIIGLSAGGLPDSSIVTADIANAAITAAKLDGAQSGSAPIYAARAWVSFNGTGTVSIYASGNVTSVTDIAVGRYEINFTDAMPDANYVISGTSGNSTGTTTSQRSITRDGTWTTTTCQIRNLASSSATDDSFTCVLVLR